MSDTSSRVVTFAHADSRLGRHLVHDPRSRAFALEPVELPTAPVLHERVAPVFDQGQVGSCTANAQLGMLGTGPLAEAMRRHTDPAAWTEADALELYRQETRLDDREIPGHYEPDDTGSAGIYACKATKARGWISAYRHAFTTRTALGWLGRQPISIGIPWMESMFEPGHGAVLRVERGGQAAGGHQICVDGIDPRRGLVRICNSWGTSWGDGGRAWLLFDDFGWLLSQGGDAVTVTVA